MHFDKGTDVIKYRTCALWQGNWCYKIPARSPMFLTFVLWSNFRNFIGFAVYNLGVGRYVAKYFGLVVTLLEHSWTLLCYQAIWMLNVAMLSGSMKCWTLLSYQAAWIDVRTSTSHEIHQEQTAESIRKFCQRCMLIKQIVESSTLWMLYMIISQTLLTRRRSYMDFRLAYLRLTWANYKG